MKMAKTRKTSEDIIKNYRERMEEWLKYAYDEGYKNGATVKREQLKRIRSDCHREAGDYDAEYAERWRDKSPFYGWCSQCEKPHSGRWAHVWEYCPWCGAKIDRTTPEPYPLGRKQPEDENENE